jgi:hypothetical protein
MTRKDVQPIARRPLSKLEFARLAVEQKGKCAKCGVKLKFEPHQIRDEHVVSLFGGGTNDLSNRQLWCLACVKPKNASDAARHAKIKRLRGQTKTGPKKKIQSRGFDKRFKRKMNGEVAKA